MKKILIPVLLIVLLPILYTASRNGWGLKAYDASQELNAKGNIREGSHNFFYGRSHSGGGSRGGK